jgi:hypothetical protein
MISIAIPYHGNRLKWTMQTIHNVHNLPFVKEIVISIDPSDYPSSVIKNAVKHIGKVEIYENDKTLYVFRNKIRAVQLCKYDWCALIDSDNIIGAAYLGSWGKAEKNKNLIYQPSIGHTMLNYEEFIGDDIGLKTAAQLVGNNNFDMLFNTMNYMFHRETWLKALEGAIASDYDPISADSAYINYNCLKAGMVIRVMHGMAYIHTIHSKKTDRNNRGFYIEHAQEGVQEYNKIKKMLLEETNEGCNSTGSIQAAGQNTVSKAPNWSGAGGPGRRILPQPEGDNDKANLLTD